MSGGKGDTGFRNNLALSRACREVDGLRHTDIDMTQWCARCKGIELLIEATSAVGHKQTQITRIIATHCGVPTMLLKHSFDDHQHQYEVSVYIWEPGRTGRFDEPDRELLNISWSKFQSVLSWFHRQHTCPEETP